MSTSASPFPSTHPANPSRRRSKPNAATQLVSHTLRPSHTYLHLRLYTPATAVPAPSVPVPDLDPLTVHAHLTAALRHALGLRGAAIPFDMLRIRGADAWVRCPAEEGRAVAVGVGSWTGFEAGEVMGTGGGRVGVAWRVVERDGWVGRLAAGDGRGLFA